MCTNSNCFNQLRRIRALKYTRHCPRRKKFDFSGRAYFREISFFRGADVGPQTTMRDCILLFRIFVRVPKYYFDPHIVIILCSTRRQSDRANFVGGLRTVTIPSEHIHSTCTRFKYSSCGSTSRPHILLSSRVSGFPKDLFKMLQYYTHAGIPRPRERPANTCTEYIKTVSYTCKKKKKNNCLNICICIILDWVMTRRCIHAAHIVINATSDRLLLFAEYYRWPFRLQALPAYRRLIRYYNILIWCTVSRFLFFWVKSVFCFSYFQII